MALPSDHTPPPVMDQEARRIFEAVFGRQPSATVVERFQMASSKLDEGADPVERRRYRTVLERVSDLEALEMAARFRGRFPLLSAKFRVMAYVAETMPENQHFFVNRRRSVAAALWAIGYGALRSAYKLAKGIILLRSLGDA